MDKNLISHEIELVKGENITVLKPIIDKLALTITGNAALGIPDKAPLEEKKAKGYNFWTTMRDALNLAANDPHAPEFNHLNKKISRYKKAYEFKPHGSNHAIWLHTEPTSSKIAPLRLEFCPQKLGKVGLQAFSDYWSPALTGYSIAFPALVHDARVTKVDIAIDILGLELADLFTYSDKIWTIWGAGSRQGTDRTFYYYKQHGHQQSPYTNPKKPAYLKVYDKRAEQIAMEKEPIYGDRQHIRVEVSVTTNRFLRAVAKQKYPFGRWQFRRICPDTAPIELWRWKLFLDSSRFRGFTNTGNLLPDGFFGETNTMKSADYFPDDLILPTSFPQHWAYALEQTNLDEWIKWTNEEITELTKL